MAWMQRSRALVLCAICTVAGLALEPKPSPYLRVSIPRLALKKGERVVGFDIHFTSGRIAAMPKVPMGWTISVSNDASWLTSIEGRIIVGAAAVGPSFFRGFILIEIDRSLEIPFDAKGEVVVSEDFVNERRLKVGLKDLDITPVH